MTSTSSSVMVIHASRVQYRKAAGSAFAVVLITGVGALGLAAVVQRADQRPVAESTVVTETVPTDIQQPGTQPLEISNLESPDKCDNCHGGYDTSWEQPFPSQS